MKEIKDEKLIARLSEWERGREEIFLARESGLTFKEVGIKFNLTPERIRQICAKVRTENGRSN